MDQDENENQEDDLVFEPIDDEPIDPDLSIIEADDDDDDEPADTAPIKSREERRAEARLKNKK